MLVEIVGLGFGALISQILEDWGWQRGCKRGDIKGLPKKPGVYVLHYPDEKAYVGSTKDLKRRLREHRKRRWKTFDWKETGSVYDARQEERALMKRLFEEGRLKRGIHRRRRQRPS